MRQCNRWWRWAALAALVAGFAAIPARAQGTGDGIYVRIEVAPSIPDSVPTGTPLDLVYTASAPDPASGGSVSCSYTNLSWTWSVPSTEISRDGMSASPGSDYELMVSQPSMGAAELDVEFTFLQPGQWIWRTYASVTADDTCGVSGWTGTGSLLAAVVAPAAVPAFKIEATPNSTVGIRSGPNDFVEQFGTVEVLRWWDVRYTAPAGITNVKWYESGVLVATGSPAVVTENTLGTYQVTMTGKNGTDDVTLGPRTLVVSAVDAPTFLLTSRDPYTKVGGIVQIPDRDARPPKYAMSMNGTVRVSAGAPALNDIQFGFVQSITGTRNITWAYDSVLMWDAASPAGTTVRRPRSFTAQNIPPNRSDQNNYGQGLFGGPYVLGDNETAYDSPGHLIDIIKVFKCSDGKLALVGYKVNGRQQYNLSFVTWLVVVHTKTGQYVPLRERNWSLTFDSNDAGPWRATVGGFDQFPLDALPNFGDSSIPWNATKASTATDISTK